MCREKKKRGTKDANCLLREESAPSHRLRILHIKQAAVINLQAPYKSTSLHCRLIYVTYNPA